MSNDYEQLLRPMAVVLETMNQTIDELRLVNGRMETRIEHHDEVLAQQAGLFARIDARQEAFETTQRHLERTLSKLDATLDAFLHHLQHPSGNGH